MVDRDSYTLTEGMPGTAEGRWDPERFYRPILSAMEDAKRMVHNEMTAVAEEFWSERRRVIAEEKATSRSGASKPSFITLTLSVSNQRGTATARWMDIHSRNGKKTGMVSRRTINGSGNYHIVNLKQGTPESLHPAIEAAEIKLRQLRKVQVQISLAKRRIQMPAAPMSASTNLSPPNLDDIDMSWATPPVPK